MMYNVNLVKKRNVQFHYMSMNAQMWSYEQAAWVRGEHKLEARNGQLFGGL